MDLIRLLCASNWYVASNIFPQPMMNKLAQKAFISWVRAYTAHRGELKRIFMVQKLHLGHVAKSFALKQQPSLVGKSFQKQQSYKRKRDQRQKGQSKRRKINGKTWVPNMWKLINRTWMTDRFWSLLQTKAVLAKAGFATDAALN